MPVNQLATLRVAQGGRIVIPAEMRQSLGLEVGADVVLTLEDDHLKLTNAKAARSSARDRVRRYVSPKRSLSTELMAQRKSEARRE